MTIGSMTVPSTHAEPQIGHGTRGGYGSYWIAWLILLGITLAMVLTGNPTILLLGIGAKATIIALWFMHLRHERLDFTLYVVLGTLLTAAFLYLLIVPDGRAM